MAGKLVGELGVRIDHHIDYHLYLFRACISLLLTLIYSWYCCFGNFVVLDLMFYILLDFRSFIK